MVFLPPRLRVRIESHARSTYPEECCGILLGRNLPSAALSIEELLESRNLANSRENRYLLDPREFLKADRRARSLGLDIVGFYHSHPDHPPLPSATDIAAAWEGYLYLIQSVTAEGPGPLRAWTFQNSRSAEVALVQGES